MREHTTPKFTGYVDVPVALKGRFKAETCEIELLRVAVAGIYSVPDRHTRTDSPILRNIESGV